MKLKALVTAALGGGLVAVAAAAPVQSPGFSRIAYELDMGGDFLEVVNAPAFQTEIEKTIDFIVSIATESGAASQKDLQDVRTGREFLLSTGVQLLRGYGASVCKQENGSFRHRSFLLTEKGRNPILDLFACRARPADVESYLPRTTAAACSLSLDVKKTALYLADLMEKCREPQAPVLRAICQPGEGQPSVVDAFAPGLLVALTLDGARQWKVPDTQLSVPAPSLLVVQAVRNEQVWTMLKSAVLSSGLPPGITCSQTTGKDFPGMERLVFSLPDGEKFNVAPACAYDRKGGVIVISSSVETLDAALAAGVKKEHRLLDDAAFGMGGPLPGEFSGLVYLSPRLLPVLVDCLRTGLALTGEPIPPTLMSFLDTPPEAWYKGTFSRVPDGLKTDAFSNFGACNTLRLLTGASGPASIGSLGILAGALFPAISSAQTSAGTSAMSMRGRNLFVGIVQANVEREATGYESVWPKTKVVDPPEGKDIAGMAFNNASDYFTALFDLPRYGTDDWMPYVSVNVDFLGTDARAGRKINVDGLDWCVAANVTDDMPDGTPVLVSANFNPEFLLAKWDGTTGATRRLPIGPASGAARSMLGDKAIVVISKGGAAQVIQAKDLTYATLYGRQSFDLTKGEVPLAYLTPTGIARPKKLVGRAAK